MPTKFRSGSKFTPGVRETIIDALRKNLPIRAACGLAGISHVQFYRWMERGETAEEGSTWQQFRLGVEQALAEAQSTNVTRIDQAAKDGDWKAAAWMLERRFPNEWGQRERPSTQAGKTVIALSFPGAPQLNSLPPSSVVEVGEPDSGSGAA